MIATATNVIIYSVRVTVETLEVLIDIMGSPESAYAYCDAVGLPYVGASSEWAPAVQQLRSKLESSVTPEDYAETAALAAKIISGIAGAINQQITPGGTVPGTLESIIIKLVVPILLFVLPRFDHLTSIPKTFRFVLYAILVLAFFTDQRLQEDHPQGLFVDRWYTILGQLAILAGWGYQTKSNGKTDTSADWAPIVSDALAAATALTAGILRGGHSIIEGTTRFWYGFDHPALPDNPIVLPIAQHAFTVAFDDPDKSITANAYDAGVQKQAPELPIAPFAITFIPVPKAVDPQGTSRLFVQVHGEFAHTFPLSDTWSFNLKNDASFGILTPADGDNFTGNASFSAELVAQTGTDPDPDPHETFAFRVGKFSLGARVDVQGPAAWLRIEQGEIIITATDWLSDFIPKMRLTFDVQATASATDGVRLEGGVGGEVLIPLNEKISVRAGSTEIATASIDSIRVRLSLADDDQNGLRLAIEGSAAVSLGIKILTLHVDGLGMSYYAGKAAGDGNIGGIAHTGWDAVLPKGAGLEINFGPVKGGGALFYDAQHSRISGALLVSIADTLTLTGLGLYQMASGAGGKSWLVSVTLRDPTPQPGFDLKGAGMLYGSNRTTDPQAFLASIHTGGLDAILFPDDPIAKAPQYLAALEQLFPTQQDSWVIGVMAQCTALGGKITLDLGVLVDSPANSPIRLYLLAQFVALLQAPKAGEKLDPTKLPFRILADGVAIWDSRTDELNMQIALRNSRVFTGELTGGATIFHGSPEVDGQHRGTYITVGGFHPDYVPPGDKIAVPDRLKLTVSQSDHLKLEVSAYVAYTPGSIQFGLAGQLEAHLYGFGIRGRALFDALFGFDGVFDFDVEFSVELLIGSESIASVMFSGKVTGAVPWVLSGKVEVQFLFWTLSKSGSLTLIDGTPNHDSIDVPEALRAAIADTNNWHGGGAAGLMLSDSPRAGLWILPGAPIQMLQNVAPLNVAIDRFSSQDLDTPVTLSIDHVTSGSTTFTPASLPGEFALGMFVQLSREEMLASRGFDSCDAGIQIAQPLNSGVSAATTGDFEEILLDPGARPAPSVIPNSAVVLGIIQVFATPRPLPKALQIRRERFALVDSSFTAQSPSQSLFRARAALRPGLSIATEAEVAG